MRRLVLALFLLSPGYACALGQLLPTPPSSVNFGHDVLFLPNGRFLVVDPGWTGNVESQGAVYFYAADGTLLNRLTGSQTDDSVGSGGIVLLANGNFLVRSPSWDAPGSIPDAGAVTFGSADNGFGGNVEVSAANSLVGSKADDHVGLSGVIALPNGNYVVASDHWNRGALAAAGAVTWGNGLTGTAGPVSEQNSLVGSHQGDHVGTRITVLPGSSHYVVASPFWSNDVFPSVGAVTVRPGNSAAPDSVRPANSWVGSLAGDQVGSGGVLALGARAVVSSPEWDNVGIPDAGAVTWLNGTPFQSGFVDSINSLVGTSAQDNVGSGQMIALTNGNYAFASPDWDLPGGAANVGAITTASGAAATAGPLSAANSLHGSSRDDRIGAGGLTSLTAGGFVAISPTWDDVAIPDAGVVSWLAADGSTVGTVSAAAGVRGASANDLVGAKVTPLPNGNYVVAAPSARVGNQKTAGSVAFCAGGAGCAKVLGSATTLFGTRTGDAVGSGGVLALADGQYLVVSPFLDTAVGVDLGGVTTGDGVVGVSGAAESAGTLLSGASPGDRIGSGGVMEVDDGFYLVMSPEWRCDLGAGCGAVSLGPTPFVQVSEQNSAFGPNGGDRAGFDSRARSTGDGRVVLALPEAGNGLVPASGAIVVLDLQADFQKAIDPDAGVRGNQAFGGAAMRFDWHEASKRLLASDPASNRVWLATVPAPLPGGTIFRDGFE